MTFSKEDEKMHQINEALGKAGLSFDPASGGVVQNGNSSGPTPSSIAMNGAADGQGRTYTSEEFATILEEVDKLAFQTAAKDERKPFEEKYAGRERLDTVRKDIETWRVLRMVDRQQSTVGGCEDVTNEAENDSIARAVNQVSRIELRIGKITIDVEEGSVRALEHLVEGAFIGFFGQEVLSKVMHMTRTDDEDEDEDDAGESGEGENESKSKSPPDPLTILPPMIIARTNSCVDSKKLLDLTDPAIVSEALDLLNTAGVANANREKSTLALSLLLSSVELYNSYKKSNSSISTNFNLKIESIYTHTIFYLAQTYGHVGDGPRSSYYCGLTTLRQLESNVLPPPPPPPLSSASTSVINLNPQFDLPDWIKNVTSLSSYYTSSSFYAQSAHLLLSTRKISESFKFNELGGEGGGMDDDGKAPSLARIEQSLAELYIRVLGEMAELFIIKAENGGSLVIDESIKSLDGELQLDYSSVMPSGALDEVPSCVMNGGLYCQLQRFVSKSSNSVILAEATCLFKMIVKSLDASLIFHVLDGHVSTNVELNLIKSNAYRQLCKFESDDKRRIAMTNRRGLILEPLLSMFNETAYLGLHKTLNFEIATSYMDLHEFKIERIEAKMSEAKANNQKPYQSKLVELQKLNSYAFKAIQSYSDFLRLYAEPAKITKPFELENVDQLMNLTDGVGVVDKDEMSGFLTGHFNIARLLSKIQPDTGDYGKDQVKMISSLQRSIQRFDFIVRLVKNLKEESLEKGSFVMQVDICKEMLKLLPVKLESVMKGARFGGNVA